jgi:hypothetical protein
MIRDRPLYDVAASKLSMSSPDAPSSVAPPRRRWRVWLVRILILFALVLGAGGAALYSYADTLIETHLRPATIALLEDRFESDVELSSLKVSIVPTLHIRGEGLKLRKKGRTDIPPLIAIRAFTISASARELWDRRIDRVHLEGLEIVVPPRRGADMPSPRTAAAPSTPLAGDGAPDAFIKELVTEDSRLTIMSKQEGKRPRVFDLRRIRFENFRFSQPSAFEANLTNPTPQGDIAVVGSFGPWQPAEPSSTAIAGSFIFNADLATIKGIGGALHAEGQFSGPLDYIRTTGKTHTDGFYLSSGGQTFPLDVDYDAIVDGTNGDTRLERVDGTLGTSHITARGEIVRVEGVSGHRITLDTTTTGGRLEDFVKLTTRVQTSPLTGIVNVKAKLDIPPGDKEVIERINLDGSFDVASAKFTSESIQSKIDELSRRGQGRPTDETIDNVASNLRGSFQLKDARMTLHALTFRVQGAEVRLAGTYHTQREVLDFNGTLRLQARPSQTTTGWKSLMLKVFDPLLDGKGAGTVLPISITGTRREPKFGADLKKAILH